MHNMIETVILSLGCLSLLIYKRFLSMQELESADFPNVIFDDRSVVLFLLLTFSIDTTSTLQFLLRLRLPHDCLTPMDDLIIHLENRR